MHRYKLIIEYDGTPFCGWQRQNGVVTIQQCLEESIQPLTKKLVTLQGAGRTDTGVHALGQVAHFDIENCLDTFRIQECMNAHLREIPISVLHVEETTLDFNARFSAIERSYIYKIINRRAKLSLDNQRAWKIIKPLNIDLMNTAAQILIGKHDFSAFRAAGCQANSPIKTLNNIIIEKSEELILIKVFAKSFLYRQVRNMIGSLVKVGTGEWSVSHFKHVFLSCNRNNAAPTAPAEGLYFWKVQY